METLIQARVEFVQEARELPPGSERDQKRQIARSLKRMIIEARRPARDYPPLRLVRTH
jgi:hypothetical protein